MGCGGSVPAKAASYEEPKAAPEAKPAAAAAAAAEPAKEEAKPAEPAKEEKPAEEKKAGVAIAASAEVVADDWGEEEEEEEEDDDDDDLDDIPMPKFFGGARSSVSAEAYSKYQDKKEELVKFDKTEEQQKRCRAAMAKSFIFEALIESELQKVVDALKIVEFEPGDTVITQGANVLLDDDGLFVLEEGELDVYKHGQDEEAPGPKIFQYNKLGDSFGDLALLYTQPRAATCKASSKCICYTLSRRGFNVLVRGAVSSRKDRYDSLLQKIDVFTNLPAGDRGRLCDALIYKPMTAGDTIVTEGEKGDVFYLIESGNCVADVAGNVVKEYGEAEYFGELALMKGSAGTRKATVKCTTTGGLLLIDRGAFKRLLAPIAEELVTRAKTNYGVDVAAEE